MSLIDTFGRKIDYLRLSVTDRCNLRCSYCMPAEGVHPKHHQDILRYEDLLRIATTATELGIEKIRITGGEPLVRKGIVEFLGRLSALPKLEQLVLTTNGTLLPEMAESLAAAGVQRLNISLDSLLPEVFQRITRQGCLDDVLAGIEAAGHAGLPMKINSVVMRGVNDEEILDFVRMSLDQALTVRFIEYMPVIKVPGWQKLVMSGREILETISNAYQIEPVESSRGCGPAKIYRVKGAQGCFGLITPLSDHFCDQCNRIRISSDGFASSCLFSNERIDLRPALRKTDPEPLANEIMELIGAKPVRHHLSTHDAPHVPFAMSNVGG